LPRPGLARRALAEAVATFALVFAGCGAIVVDAERGQALGAVGIGAVFGLVILAMVYATGPLSGAHINPAVTLAFTATRHFPLREAAAYVPAQLVGAVAGALTLRLAWDGTPADLGATVPSVGAGSALLYETILTALLMFVIVAVATDTRAVGVGRGDRDRRHRRSRRPLRRGRHRRLDESGALVRAGARRQYVDRLLDLRRRARTGSAGRRRALPGDEGARRSASGHRRAAELGFMA